MKKTKLYRSKEIREIFGITRQRLYELRQQGLPIEIKAGPKTFYYRLDKVKEWLKQRGINALEQSDK